MKKFLSLALALGLVGVFAGCSNDEKASEYPAADTATETIEEATTENTTIGDIQMGRVNYAAHADKSFAVAVVAMDGETIVNASIDEFQFMDKIQEGVVPVQNADGAFAENFSDSNTLLASKRDSTKYYSTAMAEKTKATNTVLENYGGIKAYVTGKTVAELEEELGKYTTDEDTAKMIDVVSDATLADTYGYVSR